MRGLSAGSTVIFALALYFTYSRGGWIALFVGIAIAIALDTRRLQLITTALVLAPWSITAVAVASASSALTHQSADLSAASTDGHGLAAIAIGLIVGASLTILIVDWLGTNVSVSYGVRRVYAGTLLFLLAAMLIVVFGRYGFPPTLARKAYDSFNVTNQQEARLLKLPAYRQRIAESLLAGVLRYQQSLKKVQTASRN